MTLTVVTGPPCSGKTTYVQQHAKPGHVIVDFDAIAQAMGSPVTHGHDPVIREATAKVWLAAVAEAIRQHGLGRHAWVIDSRPSAWRGERYRGAGASLVRLSASPDELHRRADQAGRPASWHQAIDTWGDSDEPAPRAGTRWLVTASDYMCIGR